MFSWPGEDAIGKPLRLSGPDGAEQWRTVVGVAPNIMQTDPTRQSYAPLVYVPLLQAPTRFLWVLARASAISSDTAAAVRSALSSVDSDLFIEQLAPLEDLLAFNPELMTVETQHLGRNAVLFPIFAISALLLAAGGLFAAVVQSVGRRTREIGVRIAIGAKPDHLRRWVIMQGMGPVALGLVVGLPASLAVNRLLQSQLIGVAFYDTSALVAGPLVFAVVGLAACWVPAHRAMNVDPVVALRSG